MNKLGPIIAFVGFIMIFVSLIVAISAVPSNLPESDSLLISSLFEGMFDDISEPFQILPGNMVYTSYSTYISDVPLLWGIQIIDYQNGDKLSVSIENIFGDSYGTYVQSDSVLFERISVQQSDTLNFEIENLGSREINFVIMFAEDPENSDTFSNPDSPVMDMVVPLMVSGFLLILGIIVVLIGIIITLIGIKNNFKNKRNYKVFTVILPKFPLVRDTSPLNSFVYPFSMATLSPTLTALISSPHNVSFIWFSSVPSLLDIVASQTSTVPPVLRFTVLGSPLPITSASTLTPLRIFFASEIGIDSDM